METRLIASLASALVVLVAGGSYIAITYREPMPAPVAEKPAQVVEKAAAWTSYAPGLGFSFRYPAEWGVPKTTFEPTSSGEGAGTFMDAEDGELMDFSVRIPYAQDGVTPLSFDGFVNGIRKDGFTEYISRKDIVVDGVKAVRVEYLHKQVLVGQQPEPTTSIYVPMPGGKVLVMSGHRIGERLGMKETFDEVIDSIRMP